MHITTSLKPNLVCSITNKVFRSPVVGSDGQCYEKQGLVESDKKLEYFKNKQLETYIDELQELDEDVKKNRYVVKTRHYDNRNKIQNLIVTDKFDKLIKYDKYDLHILMNTIIDGSSLMKKLCINCKNDSVIKHIIASCVNIYDTNLKHNIGIASYIGQHSSNKLFAYLLDNYEVDLFTVGSYYGTLLHTLCELNFTKKIKIFIEKAKKILDVYDNVGFYQGFLDTPNKESMTALHMVIKNNNYEIVKLLVNEGSTITLRSFDIATNYQICYYLLKHFPLIITNIEITFKNKFPIEQINELKKMMDKKKQKRELEIANTTKDIISERYSDDNN